MPTHRLSPPIVALIHHAELNRAGWIEGYKKRGICTLFWLQNSDLCAQDVVDQQVSVGLTGLTVVEVTKFLQELCDESFLIETKNACYRLAEHRFSEIENAISNAEQLEKAVIDQFCAIIERNLPELSISDPRSLWRQFHQELLVPLVEFFGARTYEIVTGDKTDIDQAPFAQNFLNQFSVEVRSYVRKLIDAFLDPSNLDFRSYTLRLLNNHFFLIANRYRQEHLEILYAGQKRPVIRCLLDTNFLYSILELHDNPSNDAAKALLETIERAKRFIDVRLFVFPPTIEELKRSLIANEEFLSQLTVSQTLYEAVSNGTVSGVVQKFFEESARADFNLSAKDYFDPYHNNLTHILNDKGIKVFNEKTDAYATDQRVIDDALDQQSFLTQRHLMRSMPGRPKSYEQIWHDVLLWYFIYDKRPAQVDSVIDADVIGITIDYSLIGFDSFKRNKGILGTPVFIHPATLIQLFQFFVPLDEQFEKAILDTLRMPFLLQEFSAESERTTVRILARLSRFENIDDLAPSTIRRILENEMLRDKLEATETPDMDVQFVREALIEENAVVQRELEESKVKQSEFTQKITELEGLSELDKQEIICLKSEADAREKANALLRGEVEDVKQQVSIMSRQREDEASCRRFFSKFVILPGLMLIVVSVVLGTIMEWSRNELVLLSLPVAVTLTMWCYIVSLAGRNVSSIMSNEWFVLMQTWRHKLAGILVVIGIGLYVQLFWDVLLALLRK